MILNTIANHSCDSGLNFKIIGSETEPASPSENTLWVNTSVTDIPHWGFGPVEPETAENGDVWIRTGISSPVVFNIVKENSIMIYPECVHQYIDDGWVEVETKLYNGYNWAGLPRGALYLLKNGVQNIDITGGWSGIDNSAAVLRQYTESSTGVGSGIAGVVETKSVKKIDLTKYKSMSVRIDELGSHLWIQIIDDLNNVVAKETTSVTGNYTMSLQNVFGQYYIKFKTDGWHENGMGYALHSISEIKLEQ